MPQQRAGGQREMESQQGDVDCSGNQKPNKYLRTFSHKTGHANVLRNVEAQSHSFPGGQHGSFNMSARYGGYPEFEISPTSERNM